MTRALAVVLLATVVASCDAISAARRAFGAGDGGEVAVDAEPPLDPEPPPRRRRHRDPVEDAGEPGTSGDGSGTDGGAPPSAESPAELATGDPSYREDDCESLTDISAIAGGYQSGHLREAAEGLARARYPMGLAFLRAQDDTQLSAWWKGAPDTFEGLSSRWETAIHEGSHVWRAKRWNGRTELYPVRGDLTIETRRLTTFHRSEIRSVHVDVEHDRYAKTYLDGTNGAQGFSTLLDEYQAYTHSLASRYCTRDLVPRGTRGSARDGILTMMYYVETYLMLARERHPKDYAAIVADPGHRKLIVTVWDRAELWLRRSRNERALGIDDRRIAGWVYEPARVAEIRALRAPP